MKCVEDDKVNVGDALLHAIQNESIESVVMLLNHARNKKNLRGIFGELPSTSFSPDMTPLILAAIIDNYAIIHLLLDSGFTIEHPHPIRCRCEVCGRKHGSFNSLGHSRSRLNTYRALASPSLICLTSRDPLLTAFELSDQMRQLGFLEVEFRADYHRLAAQCRQFGVDLLDQVRDSNELETVLNYDAEFRYFEERQRVWKRHSISNSSQELTIMASEINDDLSLARLKMAIRYRQKQFIAHPSCQQYLSSIWYSAIPGFRQMSVVAQFLVLLTIAIVSPVLSLVNLVVPNTKAGRLVCQPFIKFVCHACSFLVFLGLLLLQSQRIDIFNWKVASQLGQRGPNPTSTEWAIVVFVVGNVWADATVLRQLGISNYLGDRWNLYTFLVNNLFVGVCFLRTVNIYTVR